MPEYVSDVIQPSPGGSMSSLSIGTSPSPEGMFLSNLSLIDRIVAATARRHHLSSVDAEEFGAWVRSRMVESEYAVFQKFGHRSSLSTYLTSVIAHLFCDYRNSRWGRWRPSAEAKRHGPTAIRLEELLYRDGFSLREALQLLRTAGVGLSDSELSRLAARLPARALGGEVGLEAIEASSPGARTPVAPVMQDLEETNLVQQAIHDIIDELPDEDAVILRMRFWSDISVADIGRALHLESKPLYRRLEGIQNRLRSALEARGVDRERALSLLCDGAEP